jgi:phosphoglycerate dehydrogenase-like enzyme
MTPVFQSSAVTQQDVKPRRHRSEARVLFALTNEERRLFFPMDEEGDLSQSAWIVPRGLTADDWEEYLLEAKPEVLVTGWSVPRLPMDRAAVCGGSVDYVCHVAGSIRTVVSRELITRGLNVTNWGALVSPQVAEHALLLVLATLRNLGNWHEFMSKSAMEQHRQKPLLATRTLYGKRVALHGFGSIARELITLLRPFGVQVSAFSQAVPGTFIRSHGAQPKASLVELAADADVFVECEALTEMTRGSIDATVLAALPEGAAFVNVGRGAVVNETDLVAATATRGLRVASDVFVDEHMSPSSPLYGLSAAVFSPHIAGPTFDTYADCGAHALRNIAKYLKGEPLDGLITPDIFDRST